jgi:hypothetical protein
MTEGGRALVRELLLDQTDDSAPLNAIYGRESDPRFMELKRHPEATTVDAYLLYGKSSIELLQENLDRLEAEWKLS